MPQRHFARPEQALAAFEAHQRNRQGHSSYSAEWHRGVGHSKMTPRDPNPSPLEEREEGKPLRHYRERLARSSW